MKIGIMTLRLHKNYGGILQNYALNKVLSNLGYEVETLNIVWDLRYKGSQKYLTYLKRIIKNIIKREWTPLDLENRIMKSDSKTTIYTTAFKKKHIPLSKEVYIMPYADFSATNEKYDAIIVGSDQVWRPMYTKGIKRYFLDYITNSNIKKIAYAASFGTSQNEYSVKQARLCGGLLSSFKAISVREDDGINQVKSIFHIDNQVTRCIDPTMLLTVDEYKKMIGEYSEENKIFIYILDENLDKMKLVKQTENLLGLESYTLTPDGMKNDSSCVIPPVESWLKAIITSKFVITDSFHGCVFSILFNKPFIVYGNKSRGISRFKTLLNALELTSRYIDSMEHFSSLLLSESIDWKHINDLISKERSHGLSFLNKSLSE